MISATEKIVCGLLNEGLTIKDISIRRKTSIQNTYKIIRKIKEKGLLIGNSLKGFVKVSTTPPYHQKVVRLHGQEFHIKVKCFPVNYNKEPSDVFKGNRVRFFSNSVEVYSKKHFFGKSGFEAHYNSVLYFKKYFVNLQNYLGVLFGSVKEVNSHYAELDNELARDNKERGKKLDVKSSVDGKSWLKTDFSFNVNELEFLHPSTSLEDTDNLLSYLNDLRDNKPLSNSQLTSRLNDLITVNEKMSMNIALIIKRLNG